MKKYIDLFCCHRNVIIVLLTIAMIVLAAANVKKLDGTASRKVSETDLKQGYWEGFSPFLKVLTIVGDYRNNYDTSSQYEKKYILSTEKSGYLLNGPFVTLPAGSYEVHYFYEILEGNEEGMTALFSVATDTGANKVIENSIDLSSQEPGKYEETLTFDFMSEQSFVEWRVWVTENTKVRLDKTVLYKID